MQFPGFYKPVYSFLFHFQLQPLFCGGLHYSTHRFWKIPYLFFFLLLKTNETMSNALWQKTAASEFRSGPPEEWVSRGALWGWRGQRAMCSSAVAMALYTEGSLSWWAQEMRGNLPVMHALRLFQTFFKATSGELESGDWGSLLSISCRRACEQNWGHPMCCSKVTGDTDHFGKSGAGVLSMGYTVWGSFLNSASQACKLWDYTHFKNDWEPQRVLNYMVYVHRYLSY